MDLRSIILLLFLCCATFSVDAQSPNLIANGGFENYSTCPDSLHRIYKAHWTTPLQHLGSTDYMHTCSPWSSADIPNYTFGLSNAASGDGCAGLYLCLDSSFFTSDSILRYREYLVDTLIAMLSPGTKFVVSFEYFLGTNSKVTTYDLGFHLTDSMPSLSGSEASIYPQSTITTNPTSRLDSGDFIYNPLSWTSIWTSYIDTVVAQGGERYITIGSFDTISESIAVVGGSPTLNGAYVFIDNVSLTIIEGLFGNGQICLGDSAAIWSVGLDSVSWYNDSNQFISNSDSIFVSPSGTTSFFAVTSTDTFEFVVNVEVPQSNFLGPDTSICAYDSLTLSAINGNAFAWSTGAISQDIVISDTGSYTVTVNPSGCASFDTINVSYQILPSPELPDDTTICWYDSITFSTTVTDSGNLNFYWNTGSTDSFTVTNSAGIYVLTISNGDCSIADSVELMFFETESMDLGNDTALCDTQFIIEPTFSAGSFIWDNGSTVINRTIQASGIYSAMLTTGSGCIVEDSISIDLLEIPSPTIIGDTHVCLGDQDTLVFTTAQSYETYLWNYGSTSDSLFLSDSGMFGGGTYLIAVTVTNSEGCEGAEYRVFKTFDSPEVSILGDTTLCANGVDTITLTASDTFAMYNWSTGGSGISTILGDNNPSPGLEWISLVITDSNNCTAQDSIQVLFEDCLGIDESIWSKFTVYPNPTAKSVFVASEDGKPFELTIYSNQGIPILRQIVRNEIGISEIPIQSFSAGVYTLEIRSEEKSELHKLIKID